MPAPFTLELSIFNAAGERVRGFSPLHCPQAPTRLVVSPSVALPPQSGLCLLFNAGSNGTEMTLNYDACSSQGQPLATGTYMVQLATHDSFGKVQTLTTNFSVARPVTRPWVRIYGSNGECVVSLPLPGSARPASLQTDANHFAVGDGQAPLGLSLKDHNGMPLLVLWDGRNSQGGWVESGTYTVTLLEEGPNSVMESRRITVIRSTQLGTSLWLAPNPWDGGKPLTLHHGLLPQGDRAELSMYTLSGERIASAIGAPGVKALQWPGPAPASGVYIMVYQRIHNQAVMECIPLKLAVLR